MHVAAANPQAVDPSGLDPAVVAREKDVLADKVKAQGKPANVIEKIVESGLKTFYKEVCLLDQPFIHDDKKSVAQALKEAEGKVGAPIKITGFVRYALGEGIERQDTDFAAEVAAIAGKKLTGTAAPRARGGRGWPSPSTAAYRQGLGRGAVGAGRLRHPPADHRPHRHRSDRGAQGSASRSASWSAAATSFAASRCRARACRARPPTPWACSRP